MVRRDSKYYLNPLINPVGNVRQRNPTNSLEGAQRRDRPRSRPVRMAEAQSSRANGLPASQKIQIHGCRMENLRVMESWNWGRPRSLPWALHPIQERCFLQLFLTPTGPLLDMSSQLPPPPPLKSVHCITRQPGWKVLPDLSSNFPLLLVLLPEATHNEAASPVTGLTTLEKSSTARLKDHHAHPVSCSYPHHGPLLKQPRLVGLAPSSSVGPTQAVYGEWAPSNHAWTGEPIFLVPGLLWGSPHHNSAEGALQWCPAEPSSCSCCSWGPAISTQHPSLLPHHGGVAESCLPADFLRQKASPPPAQPPRDTPLVVAHGRTS